MIFWGRKDFFRCVWERGFFCLFFWRGSHFFGGAEMLCFTYIKKLFIKLKLIIYKFELVLNLHFFIKKICVTYIIKKFFNLYYKLKSIFC